MTPTDLRTNWVDAVWRVAIVAAAWTLVGCSSSDPSASSEPPDASSSGTQVVPTAPSSEPPDASSSGTQVVPTAPSSDAPVPTEARVLGSLRPLSGDVTVTLDGVSAVVSTAGSDLVAGTTIATTAGGLAEVTLAGTVVRFGSETDVLVRAGDESLVTIEIDRGSAWWTQQADVSTQIRVRLAGATATSAGARAFASCDSSGCQIGDIDGNVTVSNEAGDVVELTPLRFSSLSADEVTDALPFPPSALVALPFPATNVLMDSVAGLRPTPAEADAVDVLSTAVVDGTYSVTYRTVESDAEDVSAATIVRTAVARTDCEQFACTLVLSVDLKSADGSTITIDSPLTFDGESYTGSLASSAPCTNYVTGAVADAGIAYTAAVTLVVTAANHIGGTPTVTAFEVTTDETNVVTADGRAVDCRINLRNDPFTVHAVVVGAGTRA